MADDDDAAAAAKAAEDQRFAAEAEARRAEDARRTEEARLRTAALDEYERAHEALWAQATAIVNVKALIPVILDQATNTCTKWRGMFLTVLGKYTLTRHVLEDEAFPSRPAWVQADYCILTWIYSTVSGDLQQSLMMRQGPARGAWCYLEDEFLGQKESRALLLEMKFRNCHQESLSITDYCRQESPSITMAASLAEFGDPIGDRQMVLTLLRGLGGKFYHMVSILKMHRLFPTFAEGRTHLLLEELEIDARPLSPPSALVAAMPWPVAPGAPAPPRPGVPPPARPPAPNGQRTGRRRGRGGRNGQHQGLVAPLRLDREVNPPACIRPSRTHGLALYGCGHMTSPGAHHRRQRSAPFHSTAASAAHPAPMAASMALHPLRTARTTGELHPQVSRRPHRRTKRRPRTPLTVVHGIRTPLHTPSTP
jgi:hypothetical protein